MDHIDAPVASLDAGRCPFGRNARHDEAQLRVWQAEPEPCTVDAEPGRVIEAAAGRIVVATGDGALRLVRVQLAGRRATTAAEFLNAHSLAGATLG